VSDHESDPIATEDTETGELFIHKPVCIIHPGGHVTHHQPGERVTPSRNGAPAIILRPLPTSTKEI
jgi:hypothetical protein